MERWKRRGGKSQGGGLKKWEDQRRERVGNKKMQVREKVGKSRFTEFFQWFGAPEGRKVTSLKRRVRSQLARWEMKNFCFVVARSTFPSQNVQNTLCSDHFLTFRCRKSAHRCGTKHISKSKRAKHTTFRPLLEVKMSKKCTPLWREAHVQVKMYKTYHVQTTFGSWDVEECTRLCSKHISKSKCWKHTMFGPLFDVQMSKKCTPLWREAHVQVKSGKNWGFRTTYGRSDVEKVHTD